jgi:centractin
VYSKQCLQARSEEHPVLITEAPFNARSNRDQMAEIFFEAFRVPALFTSPSAVLSLYASGRTTGVVLDVGEGVTHAVPVYEGFCLPYSITRCDVAGRDVTRQLQWHLRRSCGLSMTTSAEADLVKSMKEDLCYVANYNMDDTALAKEAKTQYQLPDGQIINVGAERYEAPNVLFDPSLMGSEEPSVSSVLVSAIMKSDLELRPKLFSQIVLAGGTTLLPGFGERILAETKARAPSQTKIRIAAPPDRLHSAYVGGSILASLSTFRSMWVSKAEYEEYGSNILHRREL